MADGDRPIVLVPLATARKAARRAGVTLDLSAEDIALAGKWKHGWIPLDAVASAVKAKRYHGGGGEGRTVKGKGRAGSAVESRREPSRGRTKSAAVGARGRMTAHESVLAERNSFGKHRGSYDLGVSDAHHFQARHDLVKEKLGPDAHRAYSAGHARVGAVDHVRSGRAAKPAGKVKGELPTQGKTFSDAGDATVSRRGHGLPTGGQKMAKANPVGAPLEHSEPKYVTPGAYHPGNPQPDLRSASMSTLQHERDHPFAHRRAAARDEIRRRAATASASLADHARAHSDASLRDLTSRFSKGTAEGRAVRAEIARRAKRGGATGRAQQVAQDRTRRVEAARGEPKLADLSESDLQSLISRYGEKSVQADAARAEMARRSGQAETPVAELQPGDQFVREVSTLKRGKTRAVTYTVTGHSERKGRKHLLVRSTYQGDGSFAHDELPSVTVLRKGGK